MPRPRRGGTQHEDRSKGDLLKELSLKSVPADLDSKVDDHISDQNRPLANLEKLQIRFDSGEVSEAYGHNARIFDLAFSPADQSTLASASDDGTAKVWLHNPAKQQFQQVASFHGHKDSVMCLNWDASGQIVATGSADTSVQLWRPKAATAKAAGHALYGVQAVGSLEGHPEEVYAVEFLEEASGQQMLTASTWTPYLWDLETCTQLAKGPTIAGPDDGLSGDMPERWRAAHIFCLRPMPGGGPLAAASCSDGAVRFWSHRGAKQSLSPQAVARVHAKGMGSSCAWDPDGYHLASLATDGTIVIMDVRMGGEVCWAADLGRPLFACSFLPGMLHTLAVCGSGPNVSFLDSGGGNCEPGSLQQSLLESRTEPLAVQSGSIRWRSRMEGPSREEDLRTGGPTNQMENLSLGSSASSEQSSGAKEFPCVDLQSQSRTMGQRNLLCLAVSSEGSKLAASGEAALLDHAPGSRWHEGQNAGNLQSKRAAIELWCA